MIQQLTPIDSPRVHRTESPRCIDASPKEAMEMAVDFCEPVFLPASVYADDRGWSVMNQMQGVLTPQGQINYSVQYPGVIKAWHRHERQTDFWTCLNGNIKAGVYCELEHRAWELVMGEKRPGILVIPPTLWHGATTVGPTSAGLLYYVTHAYNVDDPDEERRSVESIPGFPWKVMNR